MFFGFISFLSVIWIVLILNKIHNREAVHPIDYLFVVLGWMIFALPASYRISFGG